MSASLEIKNATGSVIKFSSINQVNDDATWSVAPLAGNPILNGSSVNISMGNSSVFIAPKGVGADCKFICLGGEYDFGQIYFDDPAVGAHSFTFSNEKVFSYTVDNPSSNSYIVTIGLA